MRIVAHMTGLLQEAACTRDCHAIFHPVVEIDWSVWSRRCWEKMYVRVLRRAWHLGAKVLLSLAFCCRPRHFRIIRPYFRLHPLHPFFFEFFSLPAPVTRACKDTCYSTLSSTGDIEKKYTSMNIALHDISIEIFLLLATLLISFFIADL